MTDNKKYTYKYDMTSDDFDHIPYYDGNPVKLLRFIKTVEGVFRLVCDENNENAGLNHIMLLNKVTERLTGSAESLILSKKITSIPELFTNLKSQFSDTRIVESLIAEIYHTKIRPNESPFELLNRFEYLRNLIFNRYSIDGHSAALIKELMQRTEKEIIHQLYDQYDPLLTNFIITQDPKNLDEFRAILFTKCNFILELISRNKHKNFERPFRYKKNQFNNDYYFQPSHNSQNYSRRTSYRDEFYQSPNTRDNHENVRQKTHPTQTLHPNNPNHPFNRYKAPPDISSSGGFASNSPNFLSSAQGTIKMQKKGEEDHSSKIEILNHVKATEHCEISSTIGSKMEFGDPLSQNSAFPVNKSDYFSNHMSISGMELTEAIPSIFVQAKPNFNQFISQCNRKNSSSNINKSEMELTEVIPRGLDQGENVNCLPETEENNFKTNVMNQGLNCVNNHKIHPDFPQTMNSTEGLQTQNIVSDKGVNNHHKENIPPLQGNYLSNSPKMNESVSLQMELTHAHGFPLDDQNQKNTIATYFIPDTREKNYLNCQQDMDTSLMECTEAVPNQYRNEQYLDTQRDKSENNVSNTIVNESFDMEITEAIPKKQTKPSENQSKNANNSSEISEKEKPVIPSVEEESLKRKAQEPTWFDESDETNNKVYVSNLPTDITETEFVDLMQKCGLVMKDVDTGKMKVKLYTDPKTDVLKSDAICTYIKVESVGLALTVLDGYEYRGKKLHVERAKFTMKSSAYDPTLKPKKKKRKDKLEKMQEKLIDWRPEKITRERTKCEKVMILKNLFDHSIFDKEDLRSKYFIK